ncbi:pyrroloquinoline quinone biosynthesis peptide chaperone PqqD [Mesobacillus maritimus]|uniref:Pyrroloquinoline quinone biosynthesis peptide chaperone PqqD n=1 Tax=Mesobacillus maritimus TaxID=1643336 RepID=A0ABS7K1J4_9BACI|nr:pyrroloquinoline quinone biosynthesis peptide chaperone PqqD [Mesobacillus maritimus]MBY0096129.1 pyrroloquinoline quinone biosynthesis peptide chaperone PqqD [Mesobacillus maritimus]
MSSTIPKLAPKGRLKYDKVRGNHLLLLPEKVVVLNDSAASILTLCDGKDSVHTITEKLRSSLQLKSSQATTNGLPDFQKMEEDITNFLKEMVDQGWVVMQYDRAQE